MKRAIFSLLTVVILIGVTGCIHQHGRRPWACMNGSCAQAPEDAQSCDESCEKCRGCRLRCGHGAEATAAGPATGTVAYPYYTTRGPRDFLANNPPSIGP
ncbi:MAG: hypothetical protein LLF97_03625 [Planctomycetaceae bacterium]|nr:hypothetical protein [Planctomycetaceae bacterium]